MEETYIAIVHEKGEYDYPSKYEFSSNEERREFLKKMAGVLICTDAYYIKTKRRATK